MEGFSKSSGFGECWTLQSENWLDYAFHISIDKSLDPFFHVDFSNMKGNMTKGHDQGLRLIHKAWHAGVHGENANHNEGHRYIDGQDLGGLNPGEETLCCLNMIYKMIQQIKPSQHDAVFHVFKVQNVIEYSMR